MATNGAAPTVASKSLQTFKLDDLAQFTQEGEFGPDASNDYRALYVGRDDVHGALMYIFEKIQVSLKMNMFGFDDDDLNKLIMGLLVNPNILVQVSLDRSQAAGAHEKKILQQDDLSGHEEFATHFAIGESSTHQILHTKGGVLDNIVAFEGSTNWSASGEGTGIGLGGQANAKGFKAQANSLVIHTNPYEIAKFAATLDHWYAVAASQPQPDLQAVTAAEQAKAANAPAAADGAPAN
jgi:hypothetical protein